MPVEEGICTHNLDMKAWGNEGLTSMAKYPVGSERGDYIQCGDQGRVLY